MREICCMDGCENPVHGQGYCGKHYRRLERHGDPAIVTRRARGMGGKTASGHISVRVNGEVKYEHVAIAERAIGKALPPHAQVHHVNLDSSDNTPSNLVICPSDAYHKLLHKRQRALDACGNANYRSCCFCHQYDDPAHLIGNDRRLCHRECSQKYERERYKRRRAAA